MLSKFVAENFFSIQGLLVLGAVLYLIFVLSSRKTTSQFRAREFERPDLEKLKAGPSFADATIQKPPAPLPLPGIRLEGEPHEILGVPRNADESTINRAYKEAIKRYHPDLIQGLSADEQRFYQEAAAKLNEAKEKLLKKTS